MSVIWWRTLVQHDQEEYPRPICYNVIPQPLQPEKTQICHLIVPEDSPKGDMSVSMPSFRRLLGREPLPCPFQPLGAAATFLSLWSLPPIPKASQPPRTASFVTSPFWLQPSASLFKNPCDYTVSPDNQKNDPMSRSVISSSKSFFSYEQHSHSFWGSGWTSVRGHYSS
jgi:hypothetical protein